MLHEGFFLGVHRPHWLWDEDFRGVPLFVSHRTLRTRRGPFPRAVTSWALDSGGFSELDGNGRWNTTAEEYVVAARRYMSEIGGLVWASPQDWMCEPWIIAKTGKSVREHQRLTIENGIRLRQMAPDVPFIYVVQGWELDDYEACVDMYAELGVDLATEPIVGIGSVCRRQSTDDIGQIFAAMRARGINTHGFGVKSGGLKRYGSQLESADSMAWSYRARMAARDRATAGLAGSVQGCEKTNCANCKHFALEWRASTLAAIERIVHP